MTTLVLENVLKRDCIWVISGLAVVTTLACVYLFTMATTENMAGMMQMRPWTATHAAMMFVMWAVMMVGMMIPSVTPVILLYARVCRKQRDVAVPWAPTSVSCQAASRYGLPSAPARQDSSGS